ncbi:hypothetical protein QFC19_008769 [Naganishia cerealis]|uniref:Uncharacterized protein n=1 Tax=Naganishia cerealis TaxID=610337 RepID=A0ACC2UZQ2_9TREE|nr:hypothetical protein QFC19_008769 [Naganishia cerealis]
MPAYTAVATSSPKNGVAPAAKRAKVEVSLPRKRLRSQLNSQIPSENEDVLEDEDMTSEEEEKEEEEESDHDLTMLADRTMSPLKPSTAANGLHRVRRSTRPQHNVKTGKAKSTGKLATSAEVAQYAASSPRKRKRSIADTEEEEEEEDMESAVDSGSLVSGSPSEDYESIDDDDDSQDSAPEFIAEGESYIMHPVPYSPLTTIVWSRRRRTASSQGLVRSPRSVAKSRARTLMEGGRLECRIRIK